MKRMVLSFLLLLPSILLAQLDAMETRFIRITNESLPEVPPLPRFQAPAADLNFRQRLQSFKVTAENYQQPVDMLAAVEQAGMFGNTKIELDPISAKAYGLTGFYQYEADGATVVRNTVYKEMRGLYLLEDTTGPSLSPLRRLQDQQPVIRPYIRGRVYHW